MQFFDLLILRLYGYTSDTDIADCYFYGKHVAKNITLAKNYYQRGAASNNLRAYLCLSDIATAEGQLAEAFYYKANAFKLMQLWTRAVEAYEKAINLNHAVSMRELGDVYISDRTEGGNVIIQADQYKRYTWYRKAANAGNAMAFTLLEEQSQTYFQAIMVFADMYESGEIDHQVNINAAIELYKKAHKGGFLDATYRLGQIYEFGLNIKAEPVRGFIYYLAAAKKNHASALLAIERMTEQYSDDNYKIRLAEVYIDIGKTDKAIEIFKFLRNENNKLAINKLNQIYKKYPEFIFQFACSYKKGEIKNFYMSLAASASYTKALDYLLEVSNSNSGLAQYYLGFTYEKLNNWLEAVKFYEMAANEQHSESMYRLANIYASNRYSNYSLIIEKNLNQQLFWYEKAIISEHKKAMEELHALSKTESKAALLLAKIYEDEKNKNSVKVIEYLKIANALQDTEAAYLLGRMYHYGLNEVTVDYDLSYQYYCAGAEKKHLGCLMELEKLIEILNNDTYRYTLAFLYLKINNEILAFKYFKFLFNKGHELAKEQINIYARKNIKNALFVAKTFQQDCADSQRAYFYYGIAAEFGDKNALAILEEAVEKGDAEAQYVLGCYYSKKGDILKAINYSLLALNQKHSLATSYLITTSFAINFYLYIAQKFHFGDKNVDKNIELAILFYEKSSSQNDKDRMFTLGELYLEKIHLDLNIAADDYDKACRCFIAAAKLGRKDAIIKINSLKDMISSPVRTEISMLCKSSSYNNSQLAERWQNKKSANDPNRFFAESSIKNVPKEESVRVANGDMRQKR